MSDEQIQRLYAYSVCDVSDALLKLGVWGAGILPDILPVARPSYLKEDATEESKKSYTKVIAPAATVFFNVCPSSSFPDSPPAVSEPTATLITHCIPPRTPYADLTQSGTIVIISQPTGTDCAVLGGIMGLRMAQLGVKGVLVDGRVRDLASLRQLNIPIWCKGFSTVGIAAQVKATAFNAPIRVRQSVVEPGDIIIIDEEELGCVCIPKSCVNEVLDLLPSLVSSDKAVLEAIRKGKTIGAAFANGEAPVGFE